MTEKYGKVIALIPCFNEQGRVGSVIASIKELMPIAEVVVIDDCSTDLSRDEARKAGATVLRHFSNMGYGASLQTGYMYALANGFTTVVQLDGDGQHDPKSLDVILEPISTGRADLCIGSRYMSGGSSTTSRLRRAGQRVFAMAIRVLGGPKTTDPTSGLQAMNRRALSLFADDVFPCDYPDSDVILMAHYAGLRITEVPVSMSARTGGVSLHAGLKPLYYGIKMLFSMLIVFLNRSKWKQLSISDRAKTKDTSNAA